MNKRILEGPGAVVRLASALLLLSMGGGVAGQPSAVATAGLHVDARSNAYHLTLSGLTGTLVSENAAVAGGAAMPLVFLHTDPGPHGYAQHMVWYVGRSGTTFDLLWLYVDDSGASFYGWLYTYPSNQLISVNFNGSYTFSAPSEPQPPAPADHFAPAPPPRYAGPDFTYLNWKRESGALGSLQLSPLPGTAQGAAASASSRTLTNLRVYPLQEVDVPVGNGWHALGWQELHCIAFDAASTPYYLILYSNTPHGYAVDLTQAETYRADFGKPVTFAPSTLFSGVEQRVEAPPMPRVAAYSRLELPFQASGTYASPYADVALSVDFTAPDGTTTTVDGFWDGGKAWKARFVPTENGDWTWRTRSNDAGLTGQSGAFLCISNRKGAHGFLSVPSGALFTLADGTPFLPVYVDYPLIGRSPDELQRDLPVLAGMGFNRLIGTYILDAPQTSIPASPAGAPGSLNLPFFQGLEAAIAECNARGMAPDIGLAEAGSPALMRYAPADLSRLWRYVLARYGAYDVSWCLFGRPVGSPPPDAELVETLAANTRRDDPYRHPLTTVLAGAAQVAAPAAAPAGPTRPRADSSYIVSPAGMPLWPSTGQSEAQRARQAAIDSTRTPGAADPWLDVVTVNGGSLDAIQADAMYHKPVVIEDGSDSSDPNSMRQRLWQTVMRGGGWVRALPLQHATDLASRPDVLWTAACARLLSATHFWQLRPHDELLNNPANAGVNNGQSNPPADSGNSLDALMAQLSAPAPLNSGVSVLADPAWEYVLYFQHGGTASLDLLEATGAVQAEWLDPRNGTWTAVPPIIGGAVRSFTAPDARDWVLYLSRRENAMPSNTVTVAAQTERSMLP